MGLGTLQKRKWTTLCRAGCAGAPGPSSVALHGVIDLPDQLLEDVLEEDDADGDALGASVCALSAAEASGLGET